MSDSRPIGIFDSGIGGLTVVREILKRSPKEKIIYFGDTARVPYGTKSNRIVEKFAVQDIFFLLDKNVKLLVAACHTVSSVALDKLVSTLHLPLLGVVEPGVKAALESSRNKRIGVIGTRATIMSGSYERKLKQKDPGVMVFSRACPLFVPLAEEGWLNTDVTRSVAGIYLEPLLKEQIDTLILGCTHYPLLKPILHQVMGDSVKVIDSAEETAKLVERRLRMMDVERMEIGEPEHTFYVSDIPCLFQEVGERFLGRSLRHVERVDVEEILLEKKAEE